MLTILGAGMPRTGTASLCEALRILGFNAIHHEPQRVPLFPEPAFDWRVYDDVDAVTDAPAALYWRELSAAYGCKVILTTREVGDWWESIKRHANLIRTGEDIEHIRYTEALHTLLFGVPYPCKYWYTRRFREHAAFVKHGVAQDRVLVMDIVGGDKWSKLCRFLGVDEPEVEWPWRNRRHDACLTG